MKTMSKRVTVDLPDEVADRIARAEDPGAYVTAAVRRQMEVEQTTRALLAEHGMPVTEEGVARARARRLAKGKMSEERREELRQLGRLA